MTVLTWSQVCVRVVPVLLVCVQAFSQTPAAPTLSVLYQSTGVQSSQTGAFVALLDDVDGDGCSEYIVREASFVPQQLGSVRSGIDGSIFSLFELIPAHNCARLGDFNLDGIAEYGITTVKIPSSGFPFAEAIVYDAVTGLRILTVVPFQSANIIDDMADIGDLDGDGVSDFCVGVRSAAPAGSPFPIGSGQVYVYSGSSGALLFQIGAPPGVSSFGHTVVALGDITGDGYPEIAATHPDQVGKGSSIFSCTPVGATLLSTLPNEFVVATAGDIDFDGVPDYIVSAYGATSSISAGIVRVCSGASGQALWTIVSPELDPNARFGEQAVLAGDMDGDGFDEIAISAPGAGYPVAWQTGVVYVYSTLTREILFEAHGQGSMSFGGGGERRQLLDGGRDVNGDGFADIVVGDWLGCYGRVYGGRPAMSVLTSPGNVMSPFGGTQDTLGLGVNGQGPMNGGIGRTVVVPTGTFLNLWTVLPPLHGGSTASFAVFGRVGAVPTLADWLLPFGIGVMCIEPWVLAPANPSYCVVANNFGGLPGLVPSIPAHAPSPGSVTSVFGTVPFPITVLLQGIIEDTSVSGIPLAVTNAVRLIVH